MTDDIIDRLARDLKPVQPMRTWPMWTIAVVGLMIGALFVIFVYQPRPELTAMAHGHVPGTWMAIAKPLLFLIIGGSALAGAAGLVRPEGELQPKPLLPAAFMVLFVLAGLFIQFVTQEPGQVIQSLIGGNMLCMLTITIGGAIGFIALWGLWLRRSATSHPTALGMLAGLGMASLSAAAYAIHCNMDAPVYLLSVYGLAVVVFGAVGATLGRRLLRW